jgi:cysteine-rich repeat protein
LLALAAAAAVQAADPIVVHADGFETAVCGNGSMEAVETCDDGNVQGGDGCSTQCLTEPSFACTGSPSICNVDCAFFPPPAGFTQNGPASWYQLTGSPTFPAMNPAFAQVPHTLGLVFLGAVRGTYTSVPFTVPPDFTADVTLNWDTSQIRNAPGQSVPSVSGPVTVSSCPADFRVGIATRLDSTDYQGCKSIFVAANGAGTPRQGLTLQMSGPPSDYVCVLHPGRTYYLNYTNANPLATDGYITPGEWTCPNGLNTCGVQFYTR